MLNYLIAFIALFIPTPDSPKFVKTKLTKNISATLPDSFTLMTDDELADKYPSSRKPVAMYVSLDKQADFGVNVASHKFPGSDLHILKDFYKANLYTLYNNVQLINEEVKNINDRDFILFEFTSEVKPDEKSATPQNPIKKYTYIQYTLYNDYLMVFNFTCPGSIKSEWQKTAKIIMNSIKINKNSKVEEKK